MPFLAYRIFAFALSPADHRVYQRDCKRRAGRDCDNSTCRSDECGHGSFPGRSYRQRRELSHPVPCRGKLHCESHRGRLRNLCVQQNVVVTVDQTLTLTVTLSVGAQTETVVISDAPPLVNTSSAVLGRMVQREEIIGLPLVNRNAYTEISLTPGVQSNSASVISNPSGTPNFVIGLPSTDVVINGGIDGGTPTVSFYLDGGINLTGQRNYGSSC